MCTEADSTSVRLFHRSSMSDALLSAQYDGGSSYGAWELIEVLENTTENLCFGPLSSTIKWTMIPVIFCIIKLNKPFSKMSGQSGNTSFGYCGNTCGPSITVYYCAENKIATELYAGKLIYGPTLYEYYQNEGTEKYTMVPNNPNVYADVNSTLFAAMYGNVNGKNTILTGNAGDISLYIFGLKNSYDF